MFKSTNRIGKQASPYITAPIEPPNPDRQFLGERTMQLVGTTRMHSGTRFEGYLHIRKTQRRSVHILLPWRFFI